MSEVLYNQEYYAHLFDLTKHCLRGSDSKIFIATKTYYFGLGGGRFELDQFLAANAEKYQRKAEVLMTMNDQQSIERMILGLNHLPYKEDMEEDGNERTVEMDCADDGAAEF